MGSSPSAVDDTDAAFAAWLRSLMRDDMDAQLAAFTDRILSLVKEQSGTVAADVASAKAEEVATAVTVDAMDSSAGAAGILVGGALSEEVRG